MYGWRARIGLLVLETNTVLERDFHRMAPEGISIHSSRIPYLEKHFPLDESRRKRIAQLRIKLEDIELAASLVASAKVNVIVFGTTSGSFIEGKEYNQTIIERIQNSTGIEAITSSTAFVEAMKELEMKRIAVATPYGDVVDERAKAFLEANGVEVVNIKGLGGIGTVGNYDPYVTTYPLARAAYKKDADGLFISCTGFRAIDIIDVLERDLGKPVVTANQASMWAALKRIKVCESIEGYGQLLRRPR